MKTLSIIILTSLVVIIVVAVINFASYEDKPISQENLNQKYKK